MAAGNKIYEELIYQINTLLKQGELYPRYVDYISNGKNDYKISQVYTKKNYSTDWIDTLEDCIVNLDNIVRNPRKFIVIEEDIVDISLARSISVESVKHLSQHTNLISTVKKDGTVIPSKILNTSKEESFDIYENRFIYTLLLKLRDFIDRRFKVIQTAMLQSGEIGIDVESEFAVDGHKVNYKLNSTANFPFDSVVKGKGAQLSNVERVSHISNVVNDFLSSPFSKEMRSCALVRPPIQRTNVILKNPDFKKALVLWQFIESNEKYDFNIETVTETSELNPILSDKYRGLIYLNTILMQSIAEAKGEETGGELLKKEDITQSDEYITKNIDDYVPDDFPLLKLEIAEIQSIFQSIETDKLLTIAQRSKMNAAIDRCLRQYKINKEQEDSLLQKKLIAEQLKEEELAKKLALRELKSLENKAKIEEARRRLEAKREEERRQKELKEKIQKEKLLTAKRKEKEKRLAEQRRLFENFKKAAEAKALEDKENAEISKKKYEEAAAIAAQRLEKAQEEYNNAMIAFAEEEKALEKERREHVEHIAEIESEKVALEEEARMLERLSEENEHSAVRIKDEEKNTMARLKKESEEYWADEQELAFKLDVDQKLGVLNIHERAEMETIISSEKERLTFLNEIEIAFNKGMAADNIENINKIIEIARRFHTNEELDDILFNYEKEKKRRKREHFMAFFKRKKAIGKSSMPNKKLKSKSKIEKEKLKQYKKRK